MTKTLLQAMAMVEGFYSPKSRPSRNNNPLDLSWCEESHSFGAIQGDPRFAVFPDAKTGWRAAQKWLSVPAKISDGTLEAGYLGATLAQVINRFAPPNENQTSVYLKEVCDATGFLASTVLDPAMLQTPEAL